MVATALQLLPHSIIAVAVVVLLQSDIRNEKPFRLSSFSLSGIVINCRYFSTVFSKTIYFFVEIIQSSTSFDVLKQFIALMTL